VEEQQQQQSYINFLCFIFCVRKAREVFTAFSEGAFDAVCKKSFLPFLPPICRHQINYGIVVLIMKSAFVVEGIV